MLSNSYNRICYINAGPKTCTGADFSQAPDPPVSYYQGEGTPSLALNGPTSLRVTYGAPQYDGGDRITAFQV